MIPPINLKVVNKYKISSELGWQDIYIGRPSTLGNPYALKNESDRLIVIEQYRRWLWQQIQIKSKVYQELLTIATRIKSGTKIRLICFCSPKPCHGDIVVKSINWLTENRGEQSR